VISSMINHGWKIVDVNQHLYRSVASNLWIS